METERLLKELADWGAEPEAAIRRLLGDEEFYLRLLRKFYEEADWEILPELVSEERQHDAFAVAHRMKGSAADLCLTPLYDTLSAVADGLREELKPTLNQDMERLLTARERFFAMMKGIG